MLDFKKLTDPSYILDLRPDSNSDLAFILSIVFGLAIIASGFVWLILTRREKAKPVLKGIRTRLVRWLFTTGFVGLFLIFFRATGIPYFGMRIVLLTWLLVSLIWLILILTYLLKKFPIERSLYEEHVLRERYLPKKKVGTR
ncbi:MAG: hypothetical protein AAB647_00200 [Patescibacteria group bacterium]